MTTRPYELLARFGTDGSVAGVSIRTITTIDGKDYESEPRPLAGVTDPEFIAFSSAFSAGVLAEKEAMVEDHKTELTEKEAALTEANQTIAGLQAEIAAWESSLADKEASINQLIAEKAALADQLDAILNPPGPDVTTVSGLREYIATVRYNREVVGFTIGDQFVSTNRDELAHWFARFYDAFNWLSGNETARAINPSGLYPYKPKGGNKVAMLTAQQAVRAYQCLAWYVNACIATEGAMIAEIEKGTRLDLILDSANNVEQWPQTRFNWTT